MKKIKLLVVFTTFILVAFSINWAVSSSKMTEREKRAQVDHRIDNMAYWKRMAEAGYVPFNPEVRAEPAIFTGSKIHSPMVLTEDSPDVPVTEVNSTQSENSIIVDPMNGNTVLNSNNSTPQPASGVYGANDLYSFDAGETFDGEVQGAGGGNSGDPAACIGTDGRWYVGYISNPGGQGVAYSDNQGQSWTTKTVAPNPGQLADKNHMWLDRKVGSPYENYLYDAWTPFGGGSSGFIVLSRSTDRAETWSSPMNISSPVSGFHQGVNLNSGPNGEVYAVWGVTYSGDEGAIGFNKSLDGGATWEGAKTCISNIRGIRSSGVPQNMRVNSFPTMAVDISDGPYSGFIYVSWTNVGVPGQNSGQDRDVYMIRSEDGGETWSAPIRVNQDPIGQGKAHYFGWPTVDPSNGMLSFVYYSNQNTNNNQAEAWCAVSGNAGASFDTFKVSDVAFTPTPIPGLADNYFGDYLGITANDGWVYPCWTDNRSGHAMTYVSAFQTINILPPYALVATVDQENGESSLTWDYTEGTGFQYFNIYRNDELIDNTTEMSYTDQLADYGYYTYKVAAFYGGENESSSVSAQTQYGTSTISIDPTAYEANVYINSTIEQTMVVKNTGVLDLTFSVSPFLRMANTLNYETAKGGGDEYISRVSINGLDNTSATGYYSDFTAEFISMKSNDTYNLQVTAGNSYEGDQCAVWVDWNQNGSFDEAMVILTTDEDGKIFSASITPQKGSKQGVTRMRIRLAGPAESLSAYGESKYGEVEDYSVLIADWLTIAPDNGVVPVGDSLMIAITFDATGMEPGTYSDSFKFKTNDIDNKYFPLFFTMNVTDLQVTATASASEICDGESTQLIVTPEGGTGEYTYQWSSIPEGFTSTEQNPMVSPIEETTYVVAVNDGVITLTDSTTVAVFATPQVNLGSNQVLCEATEYPLDAGNPGATYLWSTGATTQTIVATGSGETTFWVKVTNENDCSDQDTVSINFSSLPVVSLGNDTVVCQTGTFVMNAGNQGSTYLWSTGATTQSITFNPSDYPVGLQSVTVEVTNSAGCASGAERLVEIKDCTGIDEFSSKVSLEVFPNPGNGIFNLKIENLGSQTITIKVVSVTGNLVYQGQEIRVNGSFKEQINLSEFSEGVYSVFVEGDGFVVNKKVVVRR